MTRPRDDAAPRGAVPLPRTRVHAGFIPLMDCAPLIVARELGLDRRHGFEFVLDRSVSWANIRDRLEMGALDCAHMLAPMPLAQTLGLPRPAHAVVAPMSLSLNGNAITVSLPLHAAMRSADAAATAAGGMAAARALAQVVQSRQIAGEAPLTLGMVYPFSAHNYDLRAWLASAGIDPDNDVNLIVVPPPLLVESLKAGRVDGFSVGSPWNSVAVAQGLGVIVATKADLWPASPEKVLGVREDWASRNGVLVTDIVAALIEAGRWLDLAENREEAARLLARPAYVGIDEKVLRQPLTGAMVIGDGTTRQIDDMILFHRHDAQFPWRSHALWFLAQMVRWGQVRQPFDLAATAARVYRADVYRAAAASLGLDAPAGDIRTEPEASLLLGDSFDAADPIGSLRALAIRSEAADLDAFGKR